MLAKQRLWSNLRGKRPESLRHQSDTTKMYMKRLFILALLASFISPAMAQVQSPEEFLGYPLGSTFTFHHRVAAYFEHVAANSDKVTLQNYGKTYEGRPLMVAFVSSADNLNKLEDIRQDNLRRAGMIEGTTSTEVPVVWLSYNVHGNEANSTEAAMKTIYELVKPGSKGAAWLEKSLVVIDPCINPDGRDRYVSFYTQRGHMSPNPDVNSEEHHEEWRPGRSNHYLFDLNRDWVWMEQAESAQRVALYNQWLPHIHVDFHEQGYNSPYYFAPAAEPFHKLITNWQREFQTTIGKNNAKYFDENNWLYFTKESFDLFYPSYGDTYPTFNGSIGMTYEQAGHGRGGLAVKTENGDTLTLLDRLTHHYTTGMSTIETTAANGAKVLTEFERFFKNSAANPGGQYKSFVIPGSNGRDKLNELTTWLDQLGIQYGSTSGGSRISGFHYESGQSRSYELKSGDLIITAYQPKSVLTQVLFEPNPVLSDSMTYDITAWAIPYAWGLDAYALDSKLSSNRPWNRLAATQQTDIAAPYAYLARWESVEDVRFAGTLMQAGVQVRFANGSFRSAGKNWNSGSLVILRKDNERLGARFDALVTSNAKALGRELSASSTGFVDGGQDFGSSSVSLIKAPRVAVLSEGGVSTLSFGEVWHLFEQQLGYPLTVLGLDYIGEVNLSDYDVLIAPDGRYSLDEAMLGKLNQYVANGGRLILVDGANKAVADKEGFALSTKKPANPDKEPAPETFIRRYGERGRDFITNFTAGAIYKAKLDPTHPLAYGFDNNYFDLKLNSSAYSYLQSGWNVGYLPANNGPVAGYAGAELQKKLQQVLVFGVQNKGRGQVVYLVDNPLFRSFWQNGKLIMANAVFLVGQD